MLPARALQLSPRPMLLEVPVPAIVEETTFSRSPPPLPWVRTNPGALDTTLALLLIKRPPRFCSV